jgi:3-deoxy-7-phosphoheptulonate synthase
MSYTTVAEDALLEASLDAGERARLLALPAAQRPPWPHGSPVELVREAIAGKPGLVHWAEVLRLRSLLGHVASGRLQILQAGDCAEDPAESTPDWVARKVGMLDALAGVMTMACGRPVVRIGRMGGQYAKPRSRPVERVGRAVLPVYRGHMINGPEPDALARKADPARMLACYQSSARFMKALREHQRPLSVTMWTSHEALVLDYELAMVRCRPHGSRMLASTHWPWVGNRTNNPSGAHAALLAGVINPVACKVGPAMTPRALVELCETLDPARDPGRLTLIARLGADAVSELLPPLVHAVRAAGFPAIWMCDPMHANTVTGPGGRKMRWLHRIIEEVRRFRVAVLSGGGVPGGLHLEVAAQRVLECVRDESELDGFGSAYATLCDPRLNLDQAIEVVSNWRAG